MRQGVVVKKERIVKERLREKRRRKLLSKLECTSRKLLRYVEYLLHEEKEFPEVAFGRPDDCRKCVLEGGLEACEALDNMQSAEFILHLMIGLRLPCEIKEIEAYRCAVLEWNHYLKTH